MDQVPYPLPADLGISLLTIENRSAVGRLDRVRTHPGPVARRSTGDLGFLLGRN